MDAAVTTAANVVIQQAFAKKFANFSQIFRGFRKFFEVFGRARICSDLFGPVRIHSDAFGCVRMRSEISEMFWKFSGKICINSTILNVFGCFWSFADVFGCIRMHSEVFRSFRKFSDFLNMFLENFETFQTCAYQNYSNLLVSQSSPDIR